MTVKIQKDTMSRIFKIFIFMAFNTLAIGDLTAKPATVVQASEDVWVVSEGSYPLGLSTTIESAQRGSLDIARRAAIEQAVGVYVTGETVVRNAQLADVLIHVISRGVIVDEEVLERGLKLEGKMGDQVRYTTKIRAKVRKLPSEGHGSLAVTVYLNRKVFRSGDQAEIRVRTTEDAYLYLFAISEDEQLTMLVPNRFLRETSLKAGKEFTFPSEQIISQGIRLTTLVFPGKSKAVEKIKVIATRHPMEMLKHQAPEAVFENYKSGDKRLLTDLLRTLSKLDPRDWAEDTVTYEVLPEK
jgi:hypothetical protein